VHGIDGPIRATVDLTVTPLTETRSRLTIAVDFEGYSIGKVQVPLLVRRQAQKEMPTNVANLKSQRHILRPDQSLSEWISTRVLELSYTSWDMQPYAQDLDDHGPPFQWNEERRARLRAELDDAAHIIDSFFVLRKNEERQYGEFRTRRLVLAAYDAMTEGPFVSPLDPAPGHGHRHPDRRS
jgi:hypothetical protein